MLSVVLITPRYIETGAAAGLYTAMLTQALILQGHRVHVITAMSPAPMPRHERQGAVTVHRLEPRRGSPSQAFAVAACRLVIELRRLGDCDVVECIDCPDCIAGLGLLRPPEAEPFPLVSVLVDPDSAAHALSPDANALARASIVTSVLRERSGEAAVVPPPLLDGFWEPPRLEGPALVLCDSAGPRAQALAISAFRDSEARRLGWSLAFRGPDGRWGVIGADQQHDPQHRQILITTSKATPIAPLLALGQGAMSIVPAGSSLDAEPDHPWPLTFESGDAGSLGAAIDEATQRSPSELGALAQIWHHRLAPMHEPGAIAMMHQDIWQGSPKESPRRASSRVWRSIESRLTASMGVV